MPNEYRLYFSDRRIPLVYTGIGHTKPVITIENYLKWYDLYIVFPDEHVEAFQADPVRVALFDKVETQIYHQYNESPHGDHVPNPRQLIILAHLMQCAFDDEAVEMVIGRWELEVKNNYKGIYDWICPSCKSAGFEVSKLGPDRCEFCDGTVGGNGP